MLATLISFFLLIYPVNQATANWTMVPPDFDRLRTRWEYTHAANALAMLAALMAVVISSLAWKEP